MCGESLAPEAREDDIYERFEFDWKLEQESLRQKLKSK